MQEISTNKSTRIINIAFVTNTCSQERAKTLRTRNAYYSTCSTRSIRTVFLAEHAIAGERVYLRQVVEILERGRLAEPKAVRDARREQERAHEVRRRARLARVRAQRERVQPVPRTQPVQRHQVRIPDVVNEQ